MPLPISTRSGRRDSTGRALESRARRARRAVAERPSRRSVTVLLAPLRVTEFQHSLTYWLAPLGGVERPRRAVRFARLIDRRVRALWRTCGPRRLRRPSQPDLAATQGGPA